MADTSRSLFMPFIQPNQAQKHVTHNEALRILDVLTQLAVETDDQTSPPDDPPEGTQHIVGDGATGAWAGQDGDVALFETGTWRFFAPRAGWRAYVTGREALIVHDGSEWIDLDSAELQEIEAFGIGMNALPDAPFSAKLNAAFWTALYQADGGNGDLITTLNKEDGSNDLGFIFQQDFQTKGLLGLFGTDDLRLATSTDGVTFKDGLIVNGSTGVVDQPNLPRFKAVTNFDNFAPADTWVKIAINSSEFNDQAVFDAATNTFTASVAGSYLFGASLTFKQNTSNQARMAARFLANGTDEVMGSLSEITGPHITERTSISIQSFVILSAGETMELQGKMQGQDAFFLADRTCFWGFKVG